MQGLSFDFIIPLINQDKLPNFAWLMKEGSWGKLQSFSPNDLIVLNRSFNTGKFPSKHHEFSPTIHRLLYVPQRIDVIPRYLFYTLLKRVGLLESFPQSPQYAIKDIWKIFEDNGITCLKQEPLYCIDVPEASETTQSAYNRFVKDYKLENLDILNHLRQALLFDMDCEERFMRQKEERRPQISYLFLLGLNLVESYFYKYNFPDMFGTIEQEEIAKFSSVIEEYYQFYDQILGKHLVSMKEDELILVYSPHGIEPIPVWRRLLQWIFGDPAVSAYHEGAPEGVVYFYGKNIARGLQIEGMRLIDIAPTLLNYLELPVGKDMDGIVNSSMFVEDFKVTNPVLYISSYEEVEIKKSQ
jgi:predicted AlkP superfamily phosphohydrolase/phosphomutase